MRIISALVFFGFAFVLGLIFSIRRGRSIEIRTRKAAEGMKEAVSLARGENQRLSTVFNSMVEGVIVADKAGRVTSVNPAIERIFGVSKADVEGRFFIEAIRNREISEVIDGVLKKAEDASGEINLTLPVRKVFQYNAAPIFEDTSVDGCLMVVHDITRMRRLETVRRDFIANVSHELRTPLTSIKGFVETLLEGAIDDKKEAYAFLRIIQDHAERLSNLVNDLLSLSNLESKEIALDKKEFDLRAEAEEVILGFKGQLKHRDIEITDELPPEAITADRNRFKQVLTNLIDNAIKFNKGKGFIKIYAQSSTRALKITVEDSGLGIPEKDIPRIFERFYRVDKARSRELGGTGLGLSIVKHIIELHGGEVGVESVEGLGSKFWFTLPKLIQ